MFALQPFKRLDLTTRFDSIFDQMLNEISEGFDPSFTSPSKAGYPRIDVQDLPDRFVIDATVPGLTKEDIKIEVLEEQGSRFLSIRSEKNLKSEIKKENFIRKEIHRSTFCRNLALPDNVDEDKIEASVKEGILSIEIPKKEPTKALPKTKQIAVK